MEILKKQDNSFIDLDNFTNDDFSDGIDLFTSESNIDIKNSNESKNSDIISANIIDLDESIDLSSFDLPNDYFNEYELDNSLDSVYFEELSDALISSINKLGKVDIEYIAKVTKKSHKEVILGLKGAIYQNPEIWDECFYKGYETKEEYLSGNLMNKLKIAKDMNNKYNGYFKDNIEALEATLPKNIETPYITLGAPFIPPRVIDKFLCYIFNFDISQFDKDEFRTKYDKIQNTWYIPLKSRFKSRLESNITYGTYKMDAIEIIERTLNMKSVGVYDTIKSSTSKSGFKKVLNKNDTLIAEDKQKLINQKFQDFLIENPIIFEELKTIYYQKYASNIKPYFDGSILTFPDLNSNVELYKYQKDAVYRIISRPNTLLSHDVGTGKTYIMVAASHELLRMGLSKKNMIVVPNSLLSQWEEFYHMMYPKDKVFIVDSNHFTVSRRVKTLYKMKDPSINTILINYSSFEEIPLSNNFYIELLKTEIKEIDEIVGEDDSYVSQSLKNKKSGIEKKIEELRHTYSKMDDEICFDNLGIDRLFVDEAHNYKNLPIKTRINNCLGINTLGSLKCQDLYDKIQSISKNNGGIIFATGTPITNSVTDIYVMQRYLQNDLLKTLDIFTFDQWAGVYTERKEEFEVDVDTTKFRMATRLSKFHNVKELTSLFSNVSDFYHKGLNSGLPHFSGYKDIKIKKTPDFENFLTVLSSRADMIRKGAIERTLDNMLNVTIDGRKGALDLRLIYPNLAFTTESKVYNCAENIYNIYLKTKDAKSTQVVFSDTSSPKVGIFNIYDELKRILVLMGIKENEIAYVHDAKSDDEKLELYDEMNMGDKRVLIGSTFKLGLGVNIQNKLIAIHHLDVPWRPSDMVQREGRILRQGNENSEVYIYRYITEGSFDAYSWQLLETKERFIESILEGTYDSSLDESNLDTALNYAEVKALAIGNPLIKRRVEVANELERIISIDKTNKSTRLELESEKITLPKRIYDMEVEVNNIILDEMDLDKKVSMYSPKEKSDILNLIIENLSSNILKDENTDLFKYQGFMITLPKNMIEEMPYIYLKNHGSYKIDFTDLNKGIMIRIDNFIDRFHNYAIDKANELENLKNRYNNLDFELSKELIPYEDRILELENELKQIDNELGVAYE